MSEPTGGTATSETPRRKRYEECCRCGYYTYDPGSMRCLHCDVRWVNR